MSIEGCALITYEFFALLIASTTRVEPAQVGPRLALGCWLAFLLLFGMQDAQSSFNWHIGQKAPWLWPLVVGLLISFALRVIAQKRVTLERAINLTVATGFIIILIGFVGDLLYSYIRFLDAALNHEHFPPDWVRQVTYLTFGYIIATRKGWMLGAISSIAVALADFTLSWLVLIPNGPAHTFPSTIIPESWLPELLMLTLQASAIDIAVLAFYGILGVAFAQVLRTRLFHVSAESAA